MYNDKDRQIFEFTVNGETFAVDPIAAFRTLTTFGDIDLERDFVVMRTIKQTTTEEKVPERDQVEALTKILEASRAAFGLEAFSSKGGVLDSDVIRVFGEFFGFTSDLKKKHETSPT